MTLVKSGFTNLEGLRDADVQDLVDILGVDEDKGARNLRSGAPAGTCFTLTMALV